MMDATDSGLTDIGALKKAGSDCCVLHKTTIGRIYPLNLSVLCIDVSVERPDRGDPRGDLERLLQAVSERCGLEPRVGLHLMASLQATLRTAQWHVNCVILRKDGRSEDEIIDIAPLGETLPVLGLAVDIGTTTIAAHLCDLATCVVVASGEILNPQTRFGADLTSRVSHAMTSQSGYLEMTTAVRDGLAGLAQKLSVYNGTCTSRIVDAVVVCNPIMHHLFLGIDPIELGQAPFTLGTSSALSIEARDVGFAIHPRARVYLPPAIASHVGADAAAALLSQAPQDDDAMTLLVDIGTNAEIFLGNRHRIVATSCPTGPAFEGAVISHGVRAANGAIETVRIHPTTKRVRFRVIGSDLWSDDPGFEASIAEFGVIGLCGSGVIETVAELRMTGIIDHTGRMGSAEQTKCQEVFVDGRTHSISLYGGAKPIVFTNNDVREVQMAKAALYASIRLLMDHIGTLSVDKIVLAGTFGSHLSMTHALVLGLVPDCNLGQITAVGNAAVDGACRMLFDVTARRQIEDIALSITNVETAVHPGFQDHFIAASNIPNACDRFAHLKDALTLPDVDFRGRKPRSPGLK